MRALSVSHALSALADGVYYVALPWLAFQCTGSTAVLGGVLAVAAAPRVLSLAVGGAWADRLPLRVTLAASSLASGAATGTLALLAALDLLSLGGLYAGAALLGLIDSMALPAARALVPRLVAPHRRRRSHALLGVLTQAATFVGPALAALLLSASGVGMTLAASAVLSVGAALAVLAIPAPTTRSPSSTKRRDDPGARWLRAPADLGDAVAFVRARPALLGVLGLMAGLNVALVGPVLVGGAAIAEARLGGPEAFGALVAAWGAGGLMGALAAGVRSPRRPLGGFLAAAVVMGGGLAVFAAPVGLGWLLASTVVLGVADGWLEVHAAAWMQAQTPMAMHGRVMGFVSLATVGAEPLSLLLAAAAASMGTAPLFLTSTAVLFLSTAAAMTVATRAPGPRTVAPAGGCA